MTLQERLAAIAAKTSAVTEEAVTVAPSRTRAKGLSREDCDMFDRWFNLPQGYGWKRLQAIRKMTPEDFDYERDTNSVRPSDG